MSKPAPLGTFASNNVSTCAPPLLDQALFGTTGGYINGRYCGLGSFEDGTTCCFPCPIQDWLYPSDWDDQLRVPNYLSILSVILCSFLLLSFLVLPAGSTHRHYLSVGLLFPVLLVSLSFVIPVSVKTDQCFDAITPNNMATDLTCGWTGSLVALGGIGCAVWVFLRSLWLHIRIVWDKDPGRKFKWMSIVMGSLFPLAVLTAVLSATGVSYRMGQTCLPNRDRALYTFWIWLVLPAIAGFVLQFITTGYCVYVYIRAQSRDRRDPSNSYSRNQAARKIETWRTAKRMFVLQWRNILVSICTLIGSVAFFLVFWTQDSKLGLVFNDPNNIRPVKVWIICQTMSRGKDKEECRKYVKDFTVSQASVLTSLILASLVGIACFILLFRMSMLLAWRDLFLSLSLSTRARGHIRPSSPELTTFENPQPYSNIDSPSKPLPFVSTISATASSFTNDNHELDNITPTPAGVTHRPAFERMTSDAALLPPPTSFAKSYWDESSAENSRAGTPRPGWAPGRDAPTPPPRTQSTASKRSWLSRKGTNSGSNGIAGATVERSDSSKLRGRISTPVPGTFVHVNGASMAIKPQSPVRNAPAPLERAWTNEDEESGVWRGGSGW